MHRLALTLALFLPTQAPAWEVTLGAVCTLSHETDEARVKCARDIAFGSRGDVVRIGEEAVLVLAHEEGLSKATAFLGVSVMFEILCIMARPAPG